MNAIFHFAVCLSMIGSQPAGEEKKEQAKPRFTIGKATTYIEGPLDKDGRIDYAAALNERLSKGVTSQNNAAVLLWQAMGPKPDGYDIPPKYFNLIGMEPPPEKGEYFINFSKYIQQNEEVPKDYQFYFDKIERTTSRPWSMEMQPEVAAWLKAMDKPLAVIVNATHRAHYFSPLLPKKSEDGLLLANASMPYSNTSRGIVDALLARAMRHIDKGETDAAWVDLQACHCLGRLIARGGSTLELFIGIGIDTRACLGDLVFLERSKLDATQLADCQRDLQSLMLMPSTVEKVEIFERFLFLDFIMEADREAGRGGVQKMPRNVAITYDPKDFDWTPALEIANKWYDRIIIAMNQKDRDMRNMKLKEINVELEANVLKVAKMKSNNVFPGAKAVAEQVAEIHASLSLSSHQKVLDAGDCSQQIQNNVILAFALARYKLDNGNYPKELAALAPKYIKEVPNDLFSGKPLIYRLEDKGYLLYSVGVNGKDEGGHGPEDNPKGDDLVVRMPLPEPKKK